jgi:hypothetical protein
MEYGILNRDAVQWKKYDLFDELDLDLQHEEHGRAEEQEQRLKDAEKVGLCTLLLQIVQLYQEIL